MRPVDAQYPFLLPGPASKRSSHARERISREYDRRADCCHADVSYPPFPRSILDPSSWVSSHALSRSDNLAPLSLDGRCRWLVWQH